MQIIIYELSILLIEPRTMLYLKIIIHLKFASNKFLKYKRPRQQKSYNFNLLLLIYDRRQRRNARIGRGQEEAEVEGIGGEGEAGEAGQGEEE